MEKKKSDSKNKYITALVAGISISFAVIVLIVIITNNKSKVITCTQTSDQPNLGYKTETTIEISYDGNHAKSIKSIKKIEATDKEKLTEQINSYASQYDLNNASYGGHTNSLNTIDDTHATFVGEINYEKVDMQKFIKDNPAMGQYTEGAKLTKDGAKRMYEASGATCEEYK